MWYIELIKFNIPQFNIVIGIRVYCRDVWKQSVSMHSITVFVMPQIVNCIVKQLRGWITHRCQIWHPLEREIFFFILFRSFHHNLHNHYLAAVEKNMRLLRSVVLVQLFFFKRPTFNGWRNEVILFLVMWYCNILQNPCLPIGSGEA